MFVLLRLVGINRDRRHLPVVVKNRIAGGSPALVLGPAAAQARLHFLKRGGKGALGLAGGRERKGVAGIRSPSVERTVSPARQRKLCFEEIALTRLPDDAGKPLFGVYKRGDMGEFRTVCRPRPQRLRLVSAPSVWRRYSPVEPQRMDATSRQLDHHSLAVAVNSSKCM